MNTYAWESDEHLDTSYHEAGHAVIGSLVGYRPRFATIRAGDCSQGYVEFHPLDKTVPMPPGFRHEAQRDIAYIIAGYVSENIRRVCAGKEPHPHYEDLCALQAASEVSDCEVIQFAALLKSYELVQELITANWRSIEALATELLARISLDEIDLNEVLSGTLKRAERHSDIMQAQANSGRPIDILRKSSEI